MTFAILVKFLVINMYSVSQLNVNEIGSGVLLWKMTYFDLVISKISTTLISRNCL